jgi:hypothetical protein
MYRTFPTRPMSASLPFPQMENVGVVARIAAVKKPDESALSPE